MKRIIALILAMTCVVGLFAACGDQTAPTTNGSVSTTAPGTTATTPTTGTTAPADPTVPTTAPTEPTEPPTQPTTPPVDIPTLPGAPAKGETVYIYMPSNGMAIAYTANGSKLNGVEATVADGKLAAEGGAVFQISIDENGYYTFTCGGMYLTSGETGNALTLEYDPSECSLWALEAAENGFYLRNVGAEYSGKNNQYLEYYNGFTTYGFKESNAGVYTFQFFTTNDPQPEFPPKPTLPDFDSTLTIAELLALPLKNGQTTEGRYYVRATIQSVTNAQYGEMIIFDETGSISVYGSYSADGQKRYEALDDKPVKGDEVLLYVNVKLYNGTYEINSAWIQEVKHNEVDDSAYTSMTIEDARNTETGTLVKVSGVVAQITYANGMVPNGFILVDATGSIYVYDVDLAAAVTEGSQVTLVASKTYWILDSEMNNASKFGYKGCNQLENAFLISVDGQVDEFDKTWITSTTVKEIIDTPVTTDISTKIFKVTALIKEKQGNGFTNFYFYDLDGSTSSYAYSQCNGSDFTWLREFEGKICTVYLVALNAKSTASDCYWRFLPVAVYDEGFDASTINFAENAVKYYGLGQFLTSYTGNPALELITSANNDVLGYTDAVLSYTSSDENVIKFETVDGKLIMNCIGEGTATVTVTATHNGVTYSESLEITIKAALEVDSVDVSTAVGTEIDQVVTVEGIVGPSLVNQCGFYLIDETGVIAVRTDADTMAGLQIGHLIVVKGTRVNYRADVDCHGQTCIDNAVVIANYYGNHAYSTASFVSGVTISQIYNFDPLVDYTANVYVVTGKVVVSDGGYSSNIFLQDVADGTKLRLYSSSASQYSWLQQFAGQEVTIEIAPCNWNDKNYYTGCVLAVVLEDGSKVYNEFNFQK